ncbi:MAG: hypothetical protein AAB601_02220, partial [Patescibacteria group bacterium]
ISKVVEEHRKASAAGTPFSLRGAVAGGTIIPAVIYAAFVFGILRLPGEVSEDALTGITGVSPFLLGLIGVLGLITLWTSYFMIGANVRDVLRFDFHVPRAVVVGAVVLVPPALYLAGFREFLSVLSFTGGIFLALEGIFVVAMWRRAFPRRPLRAASALLYLVFGAGLLYAVIDAVL